MSVKPIVRYMILCDDWYPDPDHGNRMTVAGVVTNFVSPNDSPLPIQVPLFNVFLILTEMRGAGSAKVMCTFEENQERVFESREHSIPPSMSPLATVAVGFRVRNCVFRRPGVYSVQVWWDGELLEQRPLRVR